MQRILLVLSHPAWRMSVRRKIGSVNFRLCRASTQQAAFISGWFASIHGWLRICERLIFAAERMNLKRYLTIYGALWKTSVTREMSFKGNFLLWIVVELAWFGLQLAFVGVIFSQTTTVGTWTVWQVVLLTGTSSFIQQIYQAFFLVNCTNLSELVRTGKMDFLLLLPVNTRFLVSMRQVDLPSFANAAFAVCIMIYAAGKLHLHPVAGQLLGFGALCAAGILVHY